MSRQAIERSLFKKSVYASAATWGFKDWLYTIVKGGSYWKQLVGHGFIVPGDEVKFTGHMPWGDDILLSGLPDTEPTSTSGRALGDAHDSGTDAKHLGD